MKGARPKQKAPRNRTLMLSEAESAIYRERLVRAPLPPEADLPTELYAAIPPSSVPICRNLPSI